MEKNLEENPGINWKMDFSTLQTIDKAVNIVQNEFYGVISSEDYNQAKELIEIITSRKLCQEEKVNELVPMNDITVGNDAPLRVATREGLFRVVDFLLKCGADLHADNDYCMKWATRMGHTQLVKLFINEGQSIREEHIIDSARFGHLDTFMFLIEKLPLSECDIVEIIIATVRISRSISILEVLIDEIGYIGISDLTRIYESAILCGSVAVTTYLLTKFDRIHFIMVFIGMAIRGHKTTTIRIKSEEDKMVWDFIDRNVGEWSDGLDYVAYIIVQDIDNIIGRDVFVSVLGTILEWGEGIDEYINLSLLIVEKYGITYKDIYNLGEDAFELFSKKIAPYITNPQQLKKILPNGTNIIEERIYKLESKAAKIIQRAWRRYEHKGGLWERIKSYTHLPTDSEYG